MVHEVNDPTQRDQLKRPITGGVSHHLSGLVAAKLRMRCRSVKPGLLGRSSMAHRSVQDVADAELAGRVSVNMLLQGETGKMVGLMALGSAEPTRLVALDEVGGVERMIPKEWLSDGPMAVGERFRKYLEPLMGELQRYSPDFEFVGRAVSR